MRYLIIFIVTGLLGWAIDTAYRSIENKRYSPGTWLPFFSLAYAAAGLMLYTLFSFWSASFLTHVLVGAVLSTALELVAGIIALYCLKKRLWDYRGSRFNFRGYIDAEHSCYWFLLTVIYRIIFQTLH